MPLRCYRTHHETKADLVDSPKCFNRGRRHLSLGFVSPAQFLQDWINARQATEVA